MGILVHSGVLPDGIPVNNVYLAFKKNTVHITTGGYQKWIIDTYYGVYKDQKSKESEVQIPIQIRTTDINTGVYVQLYDELKRQYPDSINML
jgi:hypothetical protein